MTQDSPSYIFSKKPFNKRPGTSQISIFNKKNKRPSSPKEFEKEIQEEQDIGFDEDPYLFDKTVPLEVKIEDAVENIEE